MAKAALKRMPLEESFNLSSLPVSISLFSESGNHYSALCPYRHEYHGSFIKWYPTGYGGHGFVFREKEECLQSGNVGILLIVMFYILTINKTVA